MRTAALVTIMRTAAVVRTMVRTTAVVRTNYDEDYSGGED